MKRFFSLLMAISLIVMFGIVASAANVAITGTDANAGLWAIITESGDIVTVTINLHGAMGNSDTTSTGKAVSAYTLPFTFNNTKLSFYDSVLETTTADVTKAYAFIGSAVFAADKYNNSVSTFGNIAAGDANQGSVKILLSKSGAGSAGIDFTSASKNVAVATITFKKAAPTTTIAAADFTMYAKAAPNPQSGGIGLTTDTVTFNKTNAVPPVDSGTDHAAFRVIDKTALSKAVVAAKAVKTAAVVGSASGNYPQNAYDTFATAITTAEDDFLTNVVASQTAVNTAVTNLNNAKTAFLATAITGPTAGYTDSNLDDGEIPAGDIKGVGDAPSQAAGKIIGDHFTFSGTVAQVASTSEVGIEVESPNGKKHLFPALLMDGSTKGGAADFVNGKFAIVLDGLDTIVKGGTWKFRQYYIDGGSTNVDTTNVATYDAAGYVAP